MKAFCLILGALIFICSCKKSTVTAANKVMLRVENSTGIDFVKVITSDSTYNNVFAGDTSDYKQFDKIPTAAFSQMITTENDTVYGGHIFIDMPSYYESGKYTLKIVVDTTTYYGYDCSYITE